MAVVPLRFGAGVKLEVVEATFEGVPLVTTPLGSQGLEGIANFIAFRDTAESAAAAVSQWIAADDQTWLKASRRQTQYVPEAARSFEARLPCRLPVL